MRLLHVPRPDGDGYLAHALTEAGHIVHDEADLAELLLAAAEKAHDAILVEAAAAADVPIARLARAAGRGVLIVVLDKASAAERTRLLRDGADACFVRPVRIMELEARLTALARLAPDPPAAGGLSLDLEPASRTARVELISPARMARLE